MKMGPQIILTNDNKKKSYRTITVVRGGGRKPLAFIRLLFASVRKKEEEKDISSQKKNIKNKN